MPDSLRFVAALLVIAILAAATSLAVQAREAARRSHDTATALTGGGSPERGREAAKRYGCGACHKIPGVPGADGEVGPSLAAIAKQAELAGRLSNDGPSMMRWIQHPQSIAPGVGMPDTGVTDADARDLAAYLYTL